MRFMTQRKKSQYDSEKGRYVGNGLCDYQEIIEAIEEISVLN